MKSKNYSEIDSNSNNSMRKITQPSSNRPISPQFPKTQSHKTRGLAPIIENSKNPASKNFFSSPNQSPSLTQKTSHLSPKRVTNLKHSQISSSDSFFGTFSPTSKKCKNLSNSVKKQTLPYNSTSLSPRTEKVLVNKLSKEFLDVFEGIGKEINYLVFVEILKKLSFVLGQKFFDEEKKLCLDLWEMLNVGGKIEPGLLLRYFIAVMHHRPQLSLRQEKSKDDEAEKIHKKFQVFYNNRISVTNRSSKNPSFKHAYGFTFHPEINKLSKSLAKGISIFERLSSRTSPSFKSESNKTDFSMIKEPECTFKPQINLSFTLTGNKPDKDLVKSYKSTDRNTALFNLSIGIREKTLINEKLKESKSVEEANLCTFSPKLKKRPLFVPSPKVNGSEKALKRMKDAYKLKLMQKELENKGFPYQGQDIFGNILNMKNSMDMLDKKEIKKGIGDCELRLSSIDED